MKQGIQTFSPSQEESGLLSRSASSVLLCVSAQSCPTLCDHMDCGPPGSSVHGILQKSLENLELCFGGVNCRENEYSL